MKEYKITLKITDLNPKEKELKEKDIKKMIASGEYRGVAISQIEVEEIKDEQEG